MGLVIGIVGPKGAGKGTFVSLLAQQLVGKTLETLRFSDVLYDTLRVWEVPATRENLQKLAVMMNEMGKGALSHAVHVRVRKSLADIVVIDGVRWETDLAMLRSFHKNLLVYVTADSRKRFDRLRARKEKVGEGDMTWEQFDREERALNEVCIADIGMKADVKISNDGSTKDLARQVEQFVQKYKTALV